MTVFAMGILALACSGEDGIDGATGTQGELGTDGNANVRAFVFSEVEFSGETIVLGMTGILTAEVINRDAILVYLRVGSGSLASRGRVFNLPGRVLGSFPDGIPTQYIDFWMEDEDPGKIFVHTRSLEDTTLSVDERTPVDWIKVVIIESTSIETIIGKGLGPSERVKAELEAAGISVNDYDSVCQYFGVCTD